MSLPTELPSVMMNHFYAVVKPGSEKNKLHYIATNLPMRRASMFCPYKVTAMFVRYNTRTRMWSIGRTEVASGTDLRPFRYMEVEKSEFIYQYNKVLHTLSALDFE